MKSYDVVIIGAGPAGLTVVNRLRHSALSIALLDEAHSLGGQIYKNIEQNIHLQNKELLGKDYYEGHELIENFYQHHKIDYIKNVIVWGINKEKHIFYADGTQSFKIHAKKIVIAVGAYERPYPIKGWELPGVMTASAAQIMLKNSQILVDDAIFIGTGPLMYYILDQYLKAGASIQAFIDTNPFVNFMRAMKELRSALCNLPLLFKGMSFFKTMKHYKLKQYKYAHSIILSGNNRVEKVTFFIGKKQHHLNSHQVFLHQGLIPNINLQLQIGCNKVYSSLQKCWNIAVNDFGQTSVADVFCIGDGQELKGLPSTLKQAELCALKLQYQFHTIDNTTFENHYKVFKKAFIKANSIRAFLDLLYQPKNCYEYSLDDHAIICRCENQSLKNIKESINNGALSADKIKAFTRSSMGMCQGRFCALTISQLLQDEYGVQQKEALHHRPRIPIKPISLQELATIND